MNSAETLTKTDWYSVKIPKRLKILEILLMSDEEFYEKYKPD
ncbi:MAG: hypothetical protein PHW62_00810 [Candidatus Ratteibacteria bacterium]|nr:hypothetical protein [Candidatus Ratteibacteria bacterium]